MNSPQSICSCKRAGTGTGCCRVAYCWRRTEAANCVELEGFAESARLTELAEIAVRLNELTGFAVAGAAECVELAELADAGVARLAELAGFADAGAAECIELAEFTGAEAVRFAELAE